MCGAFYAEALRAGNEGLMAKKRSSYEAGRRGASWLKPEPAHTLELVVLAVEWGSGRRAGWLSNLHLGARDPSIGGAPYEGMGTCPAVAAPCRPA